MSKWAFQILASLTLVTIVAVGSVRSQEEGVPDDEVAGALGSLNSKILIPEPKATETGRATPGTRTPVTSISGSAEPAAVVAPSRVAVSPVDAEPAAVVAAHRVTPVSGEGERVTLASGHRARAVAAEAAPVPPAPPPQASASPSDTLVQPDSDSEPCEENGRCDGRACTCPLCGACNMPQHYAYFPAMHGYYYFRPYHHSHIAKHQQIAASWGADPRFPYSNEIFKTVYAQYRKDRAQPAAPKAAGRP